MEDILLLGVGHYGISFIKSMSDQLKGSVLDCFGIRFEPFSSERHSRLELRIYKPGVVLAPNGKPLPMYMFVDGLLPRRDRLVLIAAAGECDGFFLMQTILAMAKQSVPDVRVVLRMPVQSDESDSRLIADCLADCARNLANELVLVEDSLFEHPEITPESSCEEIHKQVYLACRAFLPDLLPQYET